ncbi:uncharacterized protein BDR25DRAFT_303803 [Lindgomyces ingoldianus]|uniref:Uncharacterized protein n=1 Tax=Lindgomyces ingoldianus TaxID=673940 RepID=A0ACB6QVZ9_9PLEO|nr:uncharacterized protein BDR25DRAFT_303803 [Lindgomyces ingoldianus]KAF2470255.1 hypothetical protein BDR25DRAFT_303803 [Lindgomyces ingoldianus]
MDQYTITRAGLREYASLRGKYYYWRRIGTHEWQSYTDPQPSTQDTPEAAVPPEPLYLSLVRQRQPEPQGHHWLLFISREGHAGTVYQVKGDHTFMVYKHKENIDIVNSASFQDIFHLAQLDQSRTQRVQHWVNQEPPPRAASQAEVTETCQSWTLRVICRLIDEEIVQGEWHERLRQMIDSPILLGRR